MVVQTSAISPGLEPAAHGDRRVLPHLVDVLVHPQLVVGQRRLVVPAVGQDPEALVGQPLLPQLLEGPHHRLHVVEVEGLVVVGEVDPAGLPGDVLAPLVGVLEDRLAALGVERLDPHLEDLVGGLDAELAHRLELGREPVGVPAEATLDPAPAHRLVARDEVLDVAGEQVAVVREPVGERRAVVEDELVVAVLRPRRAARRWPGRCRRPPSRPAPAPRSAGSAGWPARRRSRRRRGRWRPSDRSSGCSPAVVGARRSRGRPLRRDRGTTSLAAPVVSTGSTNERNRSLQAVTGPPVRF